MRSPILFLVFNRPEPTRRVFETIRLAKPSRLYIAADGARSHKAGEAEKCAEVRFICGNIDWPCQVKTLYREQNLGCRRAVSGAITWFFEQEEEGIILEDDCLPSPDFFRFCDLSLERYRADTGVMHVGGHVLVEGAEISEALFSRLVPIWGWATWRRAWSVYDSDMVGLSKLDQLPLRQWYGSQAGNVRRAIERIHRDQVDAWGARWVLTVLAREALSVLPRTNLISNIGFGADATHTVVDSHMANLPSTMLRPDITFPATREVNIGYDERYLNVMNRRSHLIPRALNRLRQMFNHL